MSNSATPPAGSHPSAGTTRIVRRRDAHDEVAKLKRKIGKDRDVGIWGSRTRWSDLIVHGLVDEFHLVVGAGIIGAGTRMFEDYTASLRCVEARAFANAQSVLLRYAVTDVAK